jgi:hypothetical protein
MSAWRPGTVRNGRPVSAHARAYDRGVVTDVFAGIAVTEYGVAVRWYERLWGAAPAFLPHETEAVWEIAEHRFVYVVQRPEHAGHAMHTISSMTSTRSSRGSASGGWSRWGGRRTGTGCGR